EHTTLLTPGQTYTFQCNIGLDVTYGRTMIYSVLIDYDHYGTFGLEEWFQPGGGPVTGETFTDVTIPLNAVLGKTRMRIRTRGSTGPNTASDACSGFASGQGYDFDVTIGYPVVQSTVPPIAGFAYNILTDTAWLNSTYTFVNTSNNDEHTYWDVTGYSPTYNG